MTRGPRIPRDPRDPRPWIVTVLLRLYPTAWRLEYGSELADLLLARPLRPSVIADVLGNGLWLRARGAEPSTLLGLSAMVVILASFGVSGVSFGGTWTAWLQPSPRTFPPVMALASGFFVFLLVVCGSWTHLRHGASARRSGVSAMRMGLIAGVPIVVAGALMMTGHLDLRIVDPRIPPPAPWAVLIAPVARLPEFWIWGALGGWVAKRFTSRRVAAGSTRP